MKDISTLKLRKKTGSSRSFPFTMSVLVLFLMVSSLPISENVNGDHHYRKGLRFGSSWGPIGHSPGENLSFDLIAHDIKIDDDPVLVIEDAEGNQIRNLTPEVRSQLDKVTYHFTYIWDMTTIDGTHVEIDTYSASCEYGDFDVIKWFFLWDDDLENKIMITTDRTRYYPDDTIRINLTNIAGTTLYDINFHEVYFIEEDRETFTFWGHADVVADHLFRPEETYEYSIEAERFSPGNYKLIWEFSLFRANTTFEVLGEIPDDPPEGNETPIEDEEVDIEEEIEENSSTCGEIDECIEEKPEQEDLNPGPEEGNSPSESRSVEIDLSMGPSSEPEGYSDDILEVSSNSMVGEQDLKMEECEDASSEGESSEIQTPSPGSHRNNEMRSYPEEDSTTEDVENGRVDMDMVVFFSSMALIWIFLISVLIVSLARKKI